MHKKTRYCKHGIEFFGGRGWIRTIEAKRSRFTVCPLWPLGNSPIFLYLILNAFAEIQATAKMELVDGRSLFQKSAVPAAEPPRTSQLKTSHRDVFLTPLTLLGFKSEQRHS